MDYESKKGNILSYIEEKDLEHGIILNNIHICSLLYMHIYKYFSGSGSPVGIATDYWLDGSGSNPNGDDIFRPSRQALGPNPASCTMGTGSFLGVEEAGAWG